MEGRINREFLLETLRKLAEIPSPTGYCMDIMKEVQSIAEAHGYPFSLNQKGNGHIEIEGQDNSYCVGVAIHVDTLGEMVRSINPDGTLRITTIGGNMYSTLNGEYCKIHTRSGKVYTGTILTKSPSVHVYRDAHNVEFKEENMQLRIDEKVRCKEDVLALGIRNGDYVSIEPKYQLTESGFIKSRYLDDKAGVACGLAVMEMLKRLGVKPKYKTKLVISTFEEIGHGGACIPSDIKELISVDMGCVGMDLDGNEYSVSICQKDSRGPYDYAITSRFIELAEKHQLSYVIDVYPGYGSDTSEAFIGGNDIKGGLIGPGINASHGMERTHIEGLENTVKLLYAYLTE